MNNISYYWFVGDDVLIRLSVDVFLSPEQVKFLVEENYRLEVYRLDKVRAAYKVVTNQGVFAFKNARKMKDITQITIMIQHLKTSGFDKLPQVIPTGLGEYLLPYKSEYYCMEVWLEHMKEVSPRKMNWLKSSGIALAKYHYAGSSIPSSLILPQRMGKGDWDRRISRWQQKMRDLKDKSFYDPMEIRLLKLIQERILFLEQIFKLLKGRFPKQGYTLCHGSLHHENILVDQQKEIWLIDYERMVWDHRAKDLAQLMEYHFLDFYWPQKYVKLFLDSYHHTFPLDQQERLYLYARIAVTPKMIRYSKEYFKGNRQIREEEFAKWLQKEECKSYLLKEFLANTAC